MHTRTPATTAHPMPRRRAAARQPSRPSDPGRCRHATAPLQGVGAAPGGERRRTVTIEGRQDGRFRAGRWRGVAWALWERPQAVCMCRCFSRLPVLPVPPPHLPPSRPPPSHTHATLSKHTHTTHPGPARLSLTFLTAFRSPPPPAPAPDACGADGPGRCGPGRRRRRRAGRGRGCSP